MNLRNQLSALLLCSFLSVVLSCTSTKKVTPDTSREVTTTNSKEALEKSYVILISLDGFRWDYVDRYNPPHLSAFIKDGVKAASLIPSFPTKTFPNHYTIATGMYPDKHGLLANTFYSYEKEATYLIRDREKVVDGSFYGGTPIWVNANNAGMVTASYFFVGTEANIQGITPTYYYNYDGKVTNQARVAQAMRWLYLPAHKRPHLITMYFSDMDDAGHRYGPNNTDEIGKAVLNLDTILGDLFKGIQNTGLPVNVIIVSDHGMLEVPVDKLIATETIKNDSLYMTIDNGVILNIHPKYEQQTDAIYADLQSKEGHFKVYKTADTPYFEYTPTNKNWGAIQVLSDEGYFFSSNRSIERYKASPQQVVGHHGFDPEVKEMHGIFYAKGPDLKKGYVHPSVKNIHVYPLLCELLGLDIPSDIDGDLNQIESVLKVN